MPSNTQKTRTRRRNNKRTTGRAQKRERTLAATPKFPVHGTGTPQPPASA